MDAIRVHGGRPGRARKRPAVLLADKGYAHDSTRARLRQRRIRHVIPERCFYRLKQWRDLATRYAKRAAIFRASLVIAATMIWLNDSQDRP